MIARESKCKLSIVYMNNENGNFLGNVLSVT